MSLELRVFVELWPSTGLTFAVPSFGWRHSKDTMFQFQACGLTDAGSGFRAQDSRYTAALPLHRYSINLNNMPR